MNKIAPILTAFLVALFAFSQTLFSVDEREFAMVRQLGEVVSIKNSVCENANSATRNAVRMGAILFMFFCS